MEFMTGVKKKEDISVKTLLETPEGTEVKLEGAVHIIRDMGEVAFVILRKSEDSFSVCTKKEALTSR